MYSTMTLPAMKKNNNKRVESGNEKESIKKDAVQHKDFACNEKETINKNVVQNKDVPCNEKETIIKDIVPNKDID